MEISTILTADVLDIIFEGRNKSYGAYELRKTYKRRLLFSLGGVGTVILLLIGTWLLANNGKKDATAMILPPDTQLEDIKLPEKEEVKPPPPPKPPEPPKQIEMRKFMTTVVVPDKDVPPEEKPPVNDELEDVKIGNVNREGAIDDGVVAPPESDAVDKGIIEAPVKKDPDEPFMKVEIESKYPGGEGAWARFLHKNLRYPQEAQDNEEEGVVTVQFIVDKEGNVSDVEAISGPESLRAEAVRVIKKSGRWEPAIQNHQHVKSYKRQPIGFKLVRE